MPITRWSVISRNDEAGWCGRRKHQVVSHRGSLYLLGGYTSAGVIGEGTGTDANLNDVWKSTEGAAWVRLLERAPWSGRDGHAAVVHNGAMYLMGGTQDPRSNFSDVWRSVNGRDWVQVCRQAPWRGRWQHAALSYQGFIYVVGGWTEGPGCLSDAWRSPDGIRWTKMCSDAPWRGRMFHSVIEANGAMYLLGGSNGREKLNDVWVSTDGREWSLVTHQSQWSPRAGHACICFENSLYVIGGEESHDRLSDVWRSEDGAHWVLTEAHVHCPRQGHAAVCHRGKAMVFGGVSEGTVFLNDCLMALTPEDIMRRGLSFSREDRRTRDVAASYSQGNAPGVSSALVTASTTTRGAASTAAAPATASAGYSAQPALASNDTNGAVSALASGGDVSVVGGGTSAGGIAGGAAGSENAGVADSGTTSAPGITHARRASRSFRHQSVEDELWGWFGDDRPMSEVGVNSGGSSGRDTTADPYFRTSSARGLFPAYVGSRGAGGGGYVEGQGGGDTDVTVSTLALTERLAKLATCRLLLDCVKSEIGAIVELVSGAVRSVNGEGEMDVLERDSEDPTRAGAGDRTVCDLEGAPMEPSRGASSALRSPESAVRGVTIVEPVVVESAVETASSAPERISDESPVEEQKERSSAEGEVVTEMPADAPTLEVSGPSMSVRQVVVDSRVLLTALQKDIRRLVREGGDDAKQRIAPLIARREELAQEALPRAQAVARRLQEIAETQRSNRSHVDSVMAKVEERAKAAGGRVWAVMHARSRQRESNDSDHDDDRGGDGDHEGDREGNVLAAGLDESPSNGEALGYTRSFPGADGDRTGRGDAGRAGVNGVAGDTTYEWVLSTLDQMRQRGSPLDGEELGPGVDAGGARGVNPNGSAGTNEWGIEGMSSDSVAASFASLAERFDREIGGDGAGGDSCYGSNRRGSGVVPCISGRRATDEALAMLQAEMEEHASALSRLGVWMAKAVPARSGTDHMEVASLARTSSTLQHLFQGAGASGLVDAAPLVPSGGGEGGWGTGLPNLWLATMRGLPKSWPARASSGAVGNAQAAGDHGVLAALQLSRDLDVSEGRVRRERFKAHRAADDEIHRTPDSYKGSCILGNALILRGHDYLAQVLAETHRESSEASLLAKEGSTWASHLEELANGDDLAARGQTLRRQLQELKESILDHEDAAIDCRSALEKKRRRMAPPDELVPLQEDLAVAERRVRQARRAERRAAAAATALAHGASPEIALDLPEALNPLAVPAQVEGVNVAGIGLQLRRLSDYEGLRPMADEGSTGGGQGRHRIFLAKYDGETVVLKGYALVNALQRQSLERELRILSRIRHGAIIRAGAIVADDGGVDSPIPMLYIEVTVVCLSRVHILQHLLDQSTTTAQVD